MITEKQSKIGSRSLAVLFVLAVFSAMPAYALDGNLYASGITAPGGQVWMGTHLWVSDHGSGFCRLDPVPGSNFSINLATCIIGDGVTGFASPGQPSFDPTNNFVYVPDNSNKGTGAWRLTFDPVNETVSNPVLLDTTGLPLAANPTATTLDSAGNLYLGFIQNNSIVKITNPGIGIGTANVTFGTTSDPAVPKGVSGLAFAGGDIYLSEGAAVTKIGSAGGTAAVVPGITGDPVAGLGPTAITADGNDTIFMADTPLADGVSTIKKFTVSTNTQEIYSTTGVFPSLLTTPFLNVAGLALDPVGNLFIGDDPTAGAGIAQGRIWQVSFSSVSLAVDNASKSTVVDVNATYVLTVTNTGSLPGTFVLSIQNPQNATIAALNTSAVTLNASTSGTVMLNVTNAAEGSFVVNVTAALSTNASVNSTVSTTTTVLPITHGVTITADNATKSTVVNVNATYVLTVTNTGNVLDTFDLAVQNPQNATVAALNMPAITLNAGASGTVLLNVTNATAGSFVVSVTAALASNASVNSTVTTTTGVLLLIRGDVNGDGVMTVGDVLMTLQGVAGLRTLTPAQAIAADVNANGAVDVADGLFLAQAIAGLRAI